MFHLWSMKFWLMIIACIFTVQLEADEIQKAEQFLNSYNREFGEGVLEYETSYNFYTNENDANRKNLIAVEAKFENFKGRFAKNASSFNLKMLQGQPKIIRQLSLIQNGGILLDIKDGKLLGELKSEMIRLLETTTTCGWKKIDETWKKNCSHKWHLGDAHVPFLMERTNENILKTVWESTRTVFGSAIHLAMKVPEYLQAVGLLHNYKRNELQDFDYLMMLALKEISVLPFYYLVDKWRYGVFSGKYPFEKWQESFWNLTFRYQGLSTPVPRTENEFDPGVIPYVAISDPTMDDFISQIVQFQIFKALCKTAGYIGPLHHCVLYKNKKAGKVLFDAMKLGASKPWPDVMQLLTGKREMDAAGLLEYFKPLIDWLKKENRDANDCYGWSSERWLEHVEHTLPKPRCK